MAYTLDTKEAAKADSKSTFINESGKYLGIITRAEALVSEQGTKGIGLSFKSDAGETATYLDIYTHKSNGEALSGNQIIQSIMCCAKVRELTDGRIEVIKWDKEAKKEYKEMADGHPELMNKRIGLLLQKELSEYGGKARENMRIYAAFNADNYLTASEMIAKETQPKKLEKMVMYINEHPVNDRRTNKTASTNSAPATGSGFDDFEDDIPF